MQKATAVRLVALVALATFLNFADRGNLATAAPLLKGELQLNNTELGILLSAFYWTYIPAQLMSGWLIDRFGPWRILAAGVALWSLATILLGVVGGFALLLVLRLLLGLGESVTFPAEAKLMRKDNAATVFTAGALIAAFVSIPIVNLATPLFGMALMVHMHKRLSGPRPQLIAPARRRSMPTV